MNQSALPVSRLSRRERDVARCAATGVATRQIADELSISVRTVESHLASIYRKLGVANRTELAALVARQSSLAPSPQLGGDAAPRLTRSVTFVGRGDELSTIGAAIDASTNRTFQMVLIEGEPGVGKSSLVAHAIDRLTGERPRVLVGIGVEGLRTPFGMLVEAVSGYLDAIDGALDDVVGPFGNVLAMLMPALSDRLGGNEREYGEPNVRVVADVLRHILVRAAQSQPTVLVLEDLHWADATGIAVLERFVTDAPSIPLAIIGTFRGGEVPAGTPLFGMAAHTEHAGIVNQIRLGGLNVDDAVELYHKFGGTGATRTELGQIQESTGGNALYLSSVLQQVATGQSSNTLTTSLSDVIAHRVARLDEEQRAIIEVAAVIGLDFELDVLVNAFGLLREFEPSAISETLDRSIISGVLSESSDPQKDFAFVHAIVRQSVLKGIAPLQQAAIHGAIGAVLADQGDDAPTSWPRIIGHFIASRNPEDHIRAAQFAARLGGANIAALAPDETAMLLDSVLAALPNGTKADHVRLDLLRVLIDVHNLRLDNVAHRAAVMSGVNLAERIGDPIVVADILTHYRLLPATGTTDDEILALVDEAVAALPGDDAESLRLSALLLGYATYHRSIGGAGFRVARDAEAALARARRSGNRTAIGTSLYSLAAVLLGSPDVTRMQAALDEFEPYRRDIIHSVDGHDGRRLAGCAALQSGDRDAFDRFHARVRRLGERTRSGFMSSIAVMWDVVVALMEGRLEDAAQINDALLPMAAADPNLLLGWFVQLLPIRCAQERVSEVLELADATLDEHADLVPIQALVSLVHLQAGDVDRAWSIIEPLAITHFASIPHDWAFAATICWLAPLVSLRGSSADASVLSEWLSPYTGQLVLAGSASDVLGAADRFAGILAYRLGNDHDALSLFAKAEALERQAKAPYLAAQTSVEMLRVIRQSDDASSRKRGDELAASLRDEARLRGWTELHRIVDAL